MAQMKPHRAREVGHDPHDAGSTSSSFPPFDIYRRVHKLPRVTPSLGEIKSQPLDLTNEIDDYEYVTCV